MKLISSAPNDLNAYKIDPSDAAMLKEVIKAIDEEGLDLANPEAFDFEVTIFEDDVAGIYAARLDRHSGWGLEATGLGRKVYFEFCRSA